MAGGGTLKIAVAMSGGVDSSVAALLLAREGHEVVGVTLKIWDDSRCCSLDDADDARRVARHLGVPHFTLDARAEFEDAVIGPFVREYGAGRTPSPCVLCNRAVKFSWLARRARMLGCGKLATGHYARIVAGGDGLPWLLRGADASKDQSYFVAPQSAADLDALFFPLGGRSKEEIRRLAAEAGLPVAEKPDSQDLCFLPREGLSAFLADRRGDAAQGGEIVDSQGAPLGRHEGVYGFTVGQRKGLGVASREPLYVVAKDAATRRVTLGPRAALEHRAFEASGAAWLAPACREADFSCRVRTRSTGPLTLCRVRARGERAEVNLDVPQFAVTPGQLAVFYEGERVLGSAWIERASVADSGIHVDNLLP